VVVATDTSSLQRYLTRAAGEDTAAVAVAFDSRRLALPPPVLAEALSDSGLTFANAVRVRSIPLLTIHDGFWDRAGRLRASLRSDGYKARLADCLIAQSCIDHDIPLITYDRDFRHFQRAGLKFA
jgi:predicted nucleic acid-binding protein